MSDTTRYAFTRKPCCYSYESNTNHCPECGNEECKVDWEVPRDLEAEIDALKEQVAKQAKQLDTLVDIISLQSQLNKEFI